MVEQIAKLGAVSARLKNLLKELPAGCLAIAMLLNSLISVVLISSLVSFVSFEPEFLVQLPSGEYRYQPNSTTAEEKPTILLRMVRNRVVGVELSRDRPCFQGTLRGSAIAQATYIFAPYSPDAQHTYNSGEAIDLMHYQRTAEPLTAEERTALLTCVEVFSR